MAELKLVNSHGVADIFASALTGSQYFGGMLRLTFEAIRCDHSDPSLPNERVVVGHVVLPADAARQMAQDVLGHLDRMAQRAEVTTLMEEAENAVKN